MNLGSLDAIFRLHEYLTFDTHPAEGSSEAFAGSVDFWPRAITALPALFS